MTRAQRFQRTARVGGVVLGFAAHDLQGGGPARVRRADLELGTDGAYRDYGGFVAVLRMEDGWHAYVLGEEIARVYRTLRDAAGEARRELTRALLGWPPRLARAA